MSRHPADADPRAQAALALALARATPPGPPPDLAEIERWRRGTLTGERAAAVAAHLARDPARFAQLMELERAPDLARRLAAAGRADGARPGLFAGLLARLLTHWRERCGSPPLRWAGGLAALGLAAGLVLLVIPGPVPPDLAPWPALVHDEAMARAFRAGVRLARQEAADGTGWVVKDLDLAALGDCPTDDRACAARRDAYQGLGRWAADLDPRCTGGPAPDWPAAAQALGQLARDLAAGPDAPLAAVLAAAARTPEQARLCAAAARLLARFP